MCLCSVDRTATEHRRTMISFYDMRDTGELMALGTAQAVTPDITIHENVEKVLRSSWSNFVTRRAGGIRRARPSLCQESLNCG